MINAAPTSVRWRIVTLLMTFSFMTYFNRVSMSTIATDLIREFHISETQMGTIMSSLLLPYTICMTPGGWLSDRWGPRSALMLMGFGSAVFVALTSLAGHPLLGAGLVLISFILIRGSLGAFTAPIFPAAGRMISHWVPFKQQARANAVVICAAPLGAAAVQPVFPWLVEALGSWRLAFVVAALVTAAFTALWAWYATDQPTKHRGANEAELQLITSVECRVSSDEKGQRTDPSVDVSRHSTPVTRHSSDTRHSTRWLALFTNRNLILLTLSYATLGYFEYIFFYWMPHYFREIRHIPKHEAALYAGIVNLSMMALTPIGGWISDRLILIFSYRFGRRLVPILGMILCSALLYIGANTDRIWLIVTSFALAIGCAGATEGPFWVTAIHLGGRDGGTSAGIVNTGGNAGGFLAPIVTPWVAHLTGNWKWGLNLGSLVCLVGVVGWFFIDPEETLDASESL